MDKLGKIRGVKFGFGGYQDAMFGIWFDLGGEHWGVGNGRGVWQGKPSDGAKWTIEDKKKELAEIMLYVEQLLSEAKVDSVHQLEGIPVELTWEGQCLKSFRILTEVI